MLALLNLFGKKLTKLKKQIEDNRSTSIQYIPDSSILPKNERSSLHVKEKDKHGEIEKEKEEIEIHK